MVHWEARAPLCQFDAPVLRSDSTLARGHLNKRHASTAVCRALRRWAVVAHTDLNGHRLDSRRRAHPKGALVFQHACKLSAEGIASKRLGSRYRSGRTPDWLKFKNPEAPAALLEAEEAWGKARR